ncbi:MAG: signal recognition particle-docking protein FtsY, partial [Bdellovibrionales bacterium]
PPVEADPDISEDVKHQLEPTEAEILDDMVEEEPVPEQVVTDTPEEKLDPDEGGWLSRLSEGLSKSSSKLTKGLGDVLTKKKLDADAVEALEEALIEADLGPQTAMMLAEEISRDRFDKEVDEIEIKQALADKISEILKPVAQELDVTPVSGGPRVILVCGVNGVGKTTTIGKLAYQMHYGQGKKIVMAAGDTFRAAALEQLQIWADRVGCPLVKKELGSDAAAVAYEAYSKAKEDGADILLIDTAGRLHNKVNLMDELEKIIRVLKKHDETIPHATLLVLDSTTGQNAHSQLSSFKEIANITGLVVTKLDGSAKGGVVVSLADHFKLPIHAIGVGESIEDLQSFHPDEFARSLVGLSE